MSTLSLAEPVAAVPTISSDVGIPSPFASITTNRSKSGEVESEVVTTKRLAPSGTLAVAINKPSVRSSKKSELSESCATAPSTTVAFVRP